MTKELSCHMSHEICCNPSEFYSYYLRSILSAKSFVVIYAANNSQVTLAMLNNKLHEANDLHSY